MPKKDYSIAELVASPSFNKWVCGQASEKERIFWDQWIMEHPENRALAKKAQEEIVGLSVRPVVNPSAEVVWNSIQELLANQEREQTPSHFFHNWFKYNRLNWIIRIAASFLLIAVSGLLITYFFQFPTAQVADVIEKEVKTEYGEQKSVRFSDGSEIILNGHSRMVYTSYEAGGVSADLFLEGEAYFSISKQDYPGPASFQVRTNEGMVKVLGTRFVVSAYNDQTRVIVENGSVAVNPIGAEEATVLQPGQLGAFNVTSQSVYTEDVNPEVYTSWKTGRLYFDDTPLPDVIHRLENTHGVEVVVRDSSLLKYKISGSIESSTLEIIISALSKMLNTTIDKSDSENVIYIGDSMK